MILHKIKKIFNALFSNLNLRDSLSFKNNFPKNDAAKSKIT